jgi:hypothetical protein
MVILLRNKNLQMDFSDNTLDFCTSRWGKAFDLNCCDGLACALISAKIDVITA